MLIVGSAVTVDKAEALKLWSAVGRAVMVIVAPIILAICCGPGTVNCTLLPESEWKLPQFTGVRCTPVVPQVAVQSTPRLEESPTTVAAKLIAACAGTNAGGGWVIVMLVTPETIVTKAGNCTP